MHTFYYDKNAVHFIARAFDECQSDADKVRVLRMVLAARVSVRPSYVATGSMALAQFATATLVAGKAANAFGAVKAIEALAPFVLQALAEGQGEEMAALVASIAPLFKHVVPPSIVELFSIPVDFGGGFMVPAYASALVDWFEHGLKADGGRGLDGYSEEYVLVWLQRHMEQCFWIQFDPDWERGCHS